MPEEVWTRERIELLIKQKIEENHQLDYKAALALDGSDDKKRAVTKDVSAFANSAGGRIIYGVKEFNQKDKHHLPEKIDPIDGGKFSREWLEHIVGQIDPRIDGLRITPVRVGPQDLDTCYVVDIPQGETAHQASDLRYYRRYNFESVPMPDHEIRDVMNRRKHPKLEFQVRLFQTHKCALKILFSIKNLGRVVPNRYGVIVKLPAFIHGKLDGGAKSLLGLENDGRSYLRVAVVGQEPLFPDSDAYCEYEIPYVITGQHHSEPAGSKMFCTLHADEMSPVHREVLVDRALATWT